MGHILGRLWDSIRRLTQSGERTFTLHPIRYGLNARAVTPGCCTEFGTTMREGYSLTFLNPFAHKRLSERQRKKRIFLFSTLFMASSTSESSASILSQETVLCIVNAIPIKRADGAPPHQCRALVPQLVTRNVPRGEEQQASPEQRRAVQGSASSPEKRLPQPFEAVGQDAAHSCSFPLGPGSFPPGARAQGKRSDHRHQRDNE